MVCEQEWVSYDEEKCKEDVIEIAVQVNGKLRGRVSVPADCDEETAIEKAANDERVLEFTAGKTVVKQIYVKGKLVNIVVR